MQQPYHRSQYLGSFFLLLNPHLQDRFMDHAEAETAQPPSRVALGLVATIAGSLTLAWITFLVWLVLKALSLL
jgi:hypothetical protein